MYGIVTVQRVKAKSTGGFVVLPFETSLKLVDGKATIAQAVTDGTGPMYDSAYLFRVQNGYCGQRYGFMAALPDGTTPITTGELPMVDPITGEGIYMDAQEWNALYGDLPNRVSSLEISQATQNTQIASLETGKANTTHSHIIGDVTGLQTALNAKGNATMRVDTSVGTRVFISDGTTERMVSGDTGVRNIASMASTGWTVSGSNAFLNMRRVGSTVFCEGRLQASGNAVTLAGLSQVLAKPNTGFSWIGNFPIVGVAKKLPALSAATPTDLGVVHSSGHLYVTFPKLAGTWADGECVNFQISWQTTDPWPTTLPGTPA